MICMEGVLRAAVTVTLVPAVYHCLRGERKRARGCIDGESDFFFHLLVFEFLELQYLWSRIFVESLVRLKGVGGEGLDHDQLAYYEDCEGGLDHIGKSWVCGLGSEHCSGDRYAWSNPIQCAHGGSICNIRIPQIRDEVGSLSTRCGRRSRTLALGGPYPKCSTPLSRLGCSLK